MKIYLDDNDIGKTITYKEENGKRQYLYVHDEEGFVFKSLEELQNQKAIECLKEVREKILEIFEKTEFNPNKCGEYYGKYITTRFAGDIIDNKIKELKEEDDN